MRESQARESHAELQEIQATLRSIYVNPQAAPAPRTPPRNVASLETARSVKASSKRTRPEPHSAWQSEGQPVRQLVEQTEAQPVKQSAGRSTRSSNPAAPLERDKPTLSQPQNQAQVSQHPTQSQSTSAKSIALPPIQPRSASTQPASTQPTFTQNAAPQRLGFTVEADEPIWDGQADWQSHRSHRADPLADTVARLQEKSTQYLQQLAQSVWESPTQQIETALQQLEAQAQHINNLATTQEAAVLELKAIAKQLECDWKNLERTSAAANGYAAIDLKIPAFCEYQQTSVPLVEKDDRGIWVVSGRAIDWFKAEREAELTAQALRHRATQPSRNPKRSWTKAFSHWLLGTSSKSTSAKISVNPASSPTKRRKPQPFSLREGATLMIGAMVVRVLLNLLVAAHPVLQFPAIALMATPGAIALYRSKITPKSLLTWSGHLIAIMLGFWLAERLFF
jgi:hypothetical protein